MLANILLADPLPTPTLGLGSKGQHSTFSEHGHVAYKIKWNHECSNMVAYILLPDPGGWGQNVQNSTFSEYGNVACQIKGNSAYSYMVANILPTDHIPTPDNGGGVKRSKFNFFRKCFCCITN